RGPGRRARRPAPGGAALDREPRARAPAPPAGAARPAAPDPGLRPPGRGDGGRGRAGRRRRLGRGAGGAVTRHAYRFFADSVSGGVAVLGPRDRRHLEQVLRMRVGDTCEVAAGGRAYHARVVPGGLELMDEIETVTAPPVTVWLAQPGGRSDEAVERLTELGVSRIGAMRCRMLKGEFTDSRLDRCRRVAA